MSSIDAISKLNKISKTPTMSIIDSYLNNESALENLNISDSNDSQHEISKLKQIYQNKLKEIDSLYKEILLKDEKISQLNQKGIYSSKGNESKRNSQIKKMNEVERESNEQLKSEMNKLKEDYNEQIEQISKEHDTKVKNLRNEIQTLKSQIDLYSDSSKYISKEEHENILNDLKKKHQKELEPFEKEIAELEKFIIENYPNVLHKNMLNNNSLPNLVSNTNTEDNNYFNLEGGNTLSYRNKYNNNKSTTFNNNNHPVASENLTEFDEIENEGQSFDRKMHDTKNFSSQTGLFH